MKCILVFLFASTLALSAQSNLEKILSQALKQAATGLKPVPASDRKIVVSEVANLLKKHVTFRPDGTSSSFSTATGTTRQSLEWKNLHITTISEVAITEADRLNGVEKRYLAVLGCDATRRWDPKSNAWTSWVPTGHLLFPTGIKVERNKGKVSASGGSYLPKFSPGPGPSISNPTTKSTGGNAPAHLPPGMQRKDLFLTRHSFRTVQSSK